MALHAQRRLAVAAAWPGRHLFEIIGDPRLCAGALEPARGPAPDIVVIPCGKGKSGFHEAADQLPAEFWAKVAAGGVLVFDSSIEGHVHTPGRTAVLHQFLAKTGVPARRCVYVTQDRGYKAAYEAECATAGLGEPIRILNYDYYIKAFFKPYETRGAETHQERLAAFEARHASRPKRFICLNISARPMKVLFLLQLIKADLWDRGYISWGAYGRASNRGDDWSKWVWRAICRMSHLEGLTSQLLPYRKVLDRMDPIFVGQTYTSRANPDLVKRPAVDTPMPEHDQSWFTVVTETEMEGPRRITEKPFRSLVNFHPSIILGNPGSLERVRELGFRTFDGYFDESYDHEPDVRRRFEMVYDQVRSLCLIDEAELQRRERALEETLRFNAWHGLVELPRIYRDEIDRRFVDEIESLMLADCV